LAKDDLDEQALYIARDSVDTALRFLDAAEGAFERLRFLPEIGRRRDFIHPELSGVRCWPIPGFEKHLIFYRVDDSGLEVLRVLHSARDLAEILGPETT
jgi:toxin ParE1/3/4